VYEKTPEAVKVLLEKAKLTSGYVSMQGDIKTFIELDYGRVPVFSYFK
jgi:hypothetical protein